MCVLLDFLTFMSVNDMFLTLQLIKLKSFIVQNRSDLVTMFLSKFRLTAKVGTISSSAPPQFLVKVWIVVFPRIDHNLWERD